MRDHAVAVAARLAERAAQLASGEALARAAAWGLALRLGQRLSGGTEAALSGTALRREGDRLLLLFAPEAASLKADMVTKRHAQLASALGLTPEIRADAAVGQQAAAA